MVFQDGDLRTIRLGEREVIRRLYGAVRDRHWGTVPGVISGLSVKASSAAFQIAYRCVHRQKDIHFSWEALIAGDADGSIRFVFDGVARSTFLRNRIGLCALHPIREGAGARCRARYVNGTARMLSFPETVAPEQPVRWLHDLAGLDHEITPGIWASLHFSGETFETEDQRNWIDASFKTYSTPVRLPMPMEVRAGTRVRQEIRLRLTAPDGSPPGRRRLVRLASSGDNVRSHAVPKTVSLRLLRTRSLLPKLGLIATQGSQLPTEQALARLEELRLAHLRVDVRAGSASTSVHLTEQSSDAQVLGHEIELAVHLDDAVGWESWDAYLGVLAARLRSLETPLARIVVFGPGDAFNTTEEGLRLARKHLGVLGAPIGSGTHGDLYQLNLRRPPGDGDFIVWAMNPQAHAFDNASIAETPEAAAHQVDSVRRSFPGQPLVVSPVTLGSRGKPAFCGPPPKGKSPADPRQSSLFGAAWTLAMVKALAESGAHSITLYQTTGAHGVMTRSGTVVPLYHVLADLADFAGAEVIHTTTGHPQSVASLLLQSGARRRLLLANLTPDPVHVSLPSAGLPGPMTMRRLDPDNVREAMTDPERFRETSVPAPGRSIALPPHGLRTLDFSALTPER